MMMNDSDEFEKQAANLAEKLMETAASIPDDTLDKAYAPLLHAPLMADMLRAQVGVRLNGNFVDICADETVPDPLVDKIRASGIAALLEPAAEPASGALQKVAQAVLLAARFTAEGSQHALLTTKELDVMVAAMTTLYSRALHSMIQKNHPGPIMGNA